MSRDDVIRMALEAGAAKFYPDKQREKEDNYLVSAGFLERFAALVAAAEHERLIGNFKAPRPDKSSVFSFDKLIEFGAACALNEREACANLAHEEYTMRNAATNEAGAVHKSRTLAGIQAASSIFYAIRARSKP